MKKHLYAFVVLLIFLSACTAKNNNENLSKVVTTPSVEMPKVVITPTVQPSKMPTITPTRMSEISPELKNILPPLLAWDFYPNGIERADLLAQIPNAVKKSGRLQSDETWSRIIHMTGDVHVIPGVTLIIEPGTIILVAARSDDQEQGSQGEIDTYNPKDIQVDGSERVWFQIEGNLIINGTLEQPVIITSNSPTPQNEDWQSIDFSQGANIQISGTIIEFCSGVAVNASDVIIQQSIIRNMQQAIVIGGIGPDTEIGPALDLTPIITKNYIYNAGRNAITIRSGSPEISHNVIIGRYDLDTTGWEQGGIAADLPTCANIHHNYIEGGMPRLYDDSIYGVYFPFTTPIGANFHGICLKFEFNTIINTPLALESRPGPWSIEHNNIIPFPSSGAAEGYKYWYDNNKDVCCLFIVNLIPEEGDLWQIKLLENYDIENIDKINLTNNYWGTEDPYLIEKCLIGTEIAQPEYEPFETVFIQEALPNWEEFNWK